MEHIICAYLHLLGHRLSRYDPVHGNRDPDVPATQLGLPKAIVLEGRSAKM